MQTVTGSPRTTSPRALASYQDAAAIPLFIGSDEEGGTVTRASKNPNLFSEPLPSPQELYAAGGLDGLLERTLSYNQKLKAFGVNVNFAPVCDVSTNPDNFIYARSFGQDAQTTADYISSVVPGLRAVRYRLRLKALPRLRQQRRHAHGHRARRAPVHHV